MQKQYRVRENIPESVREVFAEYPELLQELLYHRGVTKKEEAEPFLNPDYSRHIHDPFLLSGMEKAVARIAQAIRNKERIAVYSDYDCDGIPGGVVMHDFFKKIGYEHFENYIPHRHEEGYGLNTDAIDTLAENGATLMITVDCGITDVAQVAHAKGKGIDVIVTDHHEPQETLPDGVAVLNPKKKGETYPFRGLAGSGVAFKLVQALLQTLTPEEHGTEAVPDGWEKWLLDVVGLATIADMVPLVDENRIFAHYGLIVMRKSRRPGFQKLCKLMKMNQRTITEDDVGFMIAPRINAASRMDVPMDAFHMLAEADPENAGAYAEHLHKINDKRKGVVASMVKEMRSRLSQFEEVRDVIVMGNPKWKPSLLGLAANTLAEEYNRPVFLWGREGNDVLKGSCRSDGVVDLVSLMQRTTHAFIEFGGHAYSGGFSVTNEYVHTLEDELVASLHTAETEKETPEVFVDKKLSVSDVTEQTYRQIEKLAPFGEGNPKPLFLFEKVTVAAVSHFGKEKNHLRIEITDGLPAPACAGGQTGEARTASAIGFFMTDEQFEGKLVPDEQINLVATMELSRFAGRRELRLRIVDIY